MQYNRNFKFKGSYANAATINNGDDDEFIRGQ